VAEIGEVVVPVSLRYESNVLDQQQLTRVGALQAAAQVANALQVTPEHDPVSSGYDLMALANFIVTGNPDAD
jgi:hypothetical protein